MRGTVRAIDFVELFRACETWRRMWLVFSLVLATGLGVGVIGRVVLVLGSRSSEVFLAVKSWKTASVATSRERGK